MCSLIFIFTLAKDTFMTVVATAKKQGVNVYIIHMIYYSKTRDAFSDDFNKDVL